MRDVIYNVSYIQAMRYGGNFCGATNTRRQQKGSSSIPSHCAGYSNKLANETHPHLQCLPEAPANTI